MAQKLYTSILRHKTNAKISGNLPFVTLITMRVNFGLITCKIPFRQYPSPSIGTSQKTQFVSFIVPVLSLACMQGYYGSPCTPCPVGTYKSTYGDTDACTACPDHMTTAATGSTLLSACGERGLPK